MGRSGHTHDQDLNHDHSGAPTPELHAQPLDVSARDRGFASKRPWPALEWSWLARDEVQGLGVELWSGCSRVVVVEVLVMGVTRPPHEWFLGALELVLQSGFGSEWVLTASSEKSNVLMYYACNLSSTIYL